MFQNSFQMQWGGLAKTPFDVTMKLTMEWRAKSVFCGEDKDRRGLSTIQSV